MIRIMEDLSGDWRRLDERIQHVTEEIEVLAHGVGADRLDRIDAGTQLRSTRQLTRREDTQGLRVGWRKWRNGLAVVPVIW
jgi:hypothetical protein